MDLECVLKRTSENKQSLTFVPTQRATKRHERLQKYVNPLNSALNKRQRSVTCSIKIYNPKSDESLVPLYTKTVGSVHCCIGPVRPISHKTSYSKNTKQGSDDRGGERKIWHSCPKSNPGDLCDNFSNCTITPVKIFPAGSFVTPTNLLSLVKTLEGARAWRKRAAISILADPGGRAV